eukprot:Partr_v1_DN27596_c1_g1_i3_m30708 putative aminotransferase
MRQLAKMSTTPFPPSQRIAHFKQDVWSIFSPMAVNCKAVNLGQGFPNFEAPVFIKEAARDAIFNNLNQYSPPKGLQALRQSLSETYSPLFAAATKNRPLNSETEICVTAGANEGMFSTFQAFLNDGDEVICFEPFFDQYSSNITMSGGRLVYCPLKVAKGVDTSANISARDWKIDMKELESKITARTKMIVFNTPHNPVGKVFNKAELQDIANIAIKHNIMVISDEVYEHLTYPGSEHLRIANLPGMWERTITVGSAGKSFCVTGWRVGWLIGNPELIHRCLLAHSRVVFCTNTPLQEACARALKEARTTDYFEQQRRDYLKQREYLVETFADIGLPVTVPDGSYFILVNIEKLAVPDAELDATEEAERVLCANGVIPPRSRDWKICRWLTAKIGVAAIPPSEFYGPENAHLAENYARFCFCKTDETLVEARKRLQALRKYIK